MTNKFYVYIYYDPETDKPFYVGKGISNRWQPKLRHSRQNPYLCNKLRKIGVENVIVKFALENVCEECALCCEIDLISVIGRKDRGDGPLVNMTDGGDGWSGTSHSKETRKKISKTLSGRPLGYTRSKETCKRLSVANKGRKLSEETKRKVSENSARKGKPAWNRGKKMSNEVKEKLSKALKGKPAWNKGKILGKGRKHTEEAKRKMGVARYKWWQENKKNLLKVREEAKNNG